MECHHQGDAFSETCDIQLEISVGAEEISVEKRVSSRGRHHKLGFLMCKESRKEKGNSGGL